MLHLPVILISKCPLGLSTKPHVIDANGLCFMLYVYFLAYSFITQDFTARYTSIYYRLQE